MIGHGHQRLAADMLTDCAGELRRKSEECEALRVENALLTVRLRVMEIRALRVSGGKRGIAE